MIKFNSWNKPVLTIGEIMRPASKIKDEAEAKQYLDDYVAYLQNNFGKEKEEAVSIATGNLGYCAGYFDKETCERMLRLFDANHPIFGKTYPEPAEAFCAGMVSYEPR